jgi:GNAT superfamily N-acetyltransferase
LVILPDYQGIGLGSKFLDVMARHYINMGFNFSIVTSAKNLISSLRKNVNWKMIDYSVKRHESRTNHVGLNKSGRKVKTASFIMECRK